MARKKPPEWRGLRTIVLARDQGTCQYCGRPADTVDHVRPVAAGGTDDMNNLVAACRECNDEAKDLVFGSVKEKAEYLKLRWAGVKPPKPGSIEEQMRALRGRRG